MKKGSHSFLEILLSVLGAAVLLYGLAVFSIIGGGHWFNYAFIILGLAIMAIGLFIDWILGINKALLFSMLALALLVLANFAIFEIKLCRMTNNQYDTAINDHPEWIIVLGAKANGPEQPSLEFSVRLQKAAELSTRGSVLILTGGQGRNEPVSEAECALNYISKIDGLETKEIILENKSMSTSENLVNAKKIIEDKGGSTDDPVLIISSAFHLYRASKLALDAGYSNTCYAGARGLIVLEPYYCVREYAAYVRELI